MPGARAQLITDDGSADLYGDGTEAKDLDAPGVEEVPRHLVRRHQLSRGQGEDGTWAVLALPRGQGSSAARGYASDRDASSSVWARPSLRMRWSM